MVGTRTSTVALLSGATTFALRPPSIVPTLTVIPFSTSLSAKSFWMTSESSKIALAPFPGSRPACAAFPRTVIEKLPTPLRAVLRSPSGPSEGSSTKQRSALRAKRMITRVDSWLPISSSELMKNTGVTGKSSAPTAASASMANSP